MSQSEKSLSAKNQTEQISLVHRPLLVQPILVARSLSVLARVLQRPSGLLEKGSGEGVYFLGGRGGAFGGAGIVVVWEEGGLISFGK